MAPDDDRDEDTLEDDLGGVGERDPAADEGEDGMGSLPHMPVEDEPDR